MEKKGGLNGTSNLEGDSDIEDVPETKLDADLHKSNSEEKKGDNNKEYNLDDSLKYPPGFTHIGTTEAHSNKCEESRQEGDDDSHSNQDEEGIIRVKKHCSYKNSKEDICGN
ncbi:hypothetical protein Tco_0421486 [Tanacetum coccineum]